MLKPKVATQKRRGGGGKGVKEEDRIKSNDQWGIGRSRSLSVRAPTNQHYTVIFVQSFLTLIRTILTWCFGFAIASWLTLFSDGLIYHRTLAYEGEGRRVKYSWRMVLPQTFPTFNHYNYIVESKLLIDVSAMFARNPSSEIRQSGKSITVIQLKSKYFNRHLRLIWWQTF